MWTNTKTVSTNDWIVDETSVDRLYGIQVDWDSVPDAYDETGVVPSGTAMVKLSSGKYAPRVGIDDANGDAVGTEEAVGFLIGNAHKEDVYRKSDALTGHGLIVGGILCETMLPDSGDAAWSTIKTELASNGTGFIYETYANNAA